jgi:hypothetical protein
MQVLRHGRAVKVRRNVLDRFSVLVSRTGGLVEKDDLTEAIWPDAADKENHLAHLHWSNNSTAPVLELLARRDDPAHSSLIGDDADLTEDTERVGACV